MADGTMTEARLSESERDVANVVEAGSIIEALGGASA